MRAITGVPDGPMGPVGRGSLVWCVVGLCGSGWVRVFEGPRAVLHRELLT
jgi:hypothetical protein